MINKNPLVLSATFHLLLVLTGLGLYWASHLKLPARKVEIEVLEFPKAASTQLQLQPKAIPKSPPPIEKPRSVFGASRKSIEAVESNNNTAQIKKGNTIAKEQDNLTLNKEDADSLPIPADDFLLTQMPKIKSEFRIDYPEAAKKAGIEGPVVMDLLIDTNGKVRKVDLIEGPGYGLNEAAAEALMKFEFSPGQIQGQAVAVKIRYIYRFVLEGGR